MGAPQVRLRFCASFGMNRFVAPRPCVLDFPGSRMASSNFARAQRCCAWELP